MSDDYKKTKAKRMVKELRDQLAEANIAFERLLDKYKNCDTQTREYIQEYMELLGIECNKYVFGFGLAMSIPAMQRALAKTQDDSVGDHPMSIDKLSERELRILGLLD